MCLLLCVRVGWCLPTVFAYWVCLLVLMLHADVLCVRSEQLSVIPSAHRQDVRFSQQIIYIFHPVRDGLEFLFTWIHFILFRKLFLDLHLLVLF